MTKFGIRGCILVCLAKYGKGPYIAGIRVFNHLPQKFKTLAQNPNKFKTAVKNFSHQHSFYSIEEYFDFKVNSV